MLLKKYLRKEVHNSWGKHFRQNNIYVCNVSGCLEDLELHHTDISFNQIIDIAHKELGLRRYKEKEKYKKNDLEKLKYKVIYLHYRYCDNAMYLRNDIHKDLHSRYGEIVTKENIIEYKEKYFNEKKH